MEVHFTPEQEAQLSLIASHAGTDTERLVKDAALRLLEQDARFRAARARRHRPGRPGGIHRRGRDGCAHRADAQLLMRIRWTFPEMGNASLFLVLSLTLMHTLS
jgi:hypothetical protein